MRAVLSTLVLAVGLVVQGQAQTLPLPMKPDSVKFLVIGDSGTGGGAQKRVAAQIAKSHKQFPFEFALMLGDNLYGREREGDYRDKFEEPYKALLDAGVKFYASLGNHDEPEQRFYKLFNMDGKRYYSFKPPRGSIRFYAVDSTYMDKEQLGWLEKELSGSDSEWKIAFFHHPLYSSGRKHGPNTELREMIEPLFVKHGVDVVFTGHEHFYERLKPQKGITYFVNGNAAKLRRDNIGKSNMTAKGFDDGYAYMLVEIAGDEMHFVTLDGNGKKVDSGVILRRESKALTSR